ncbi:MAG TPA: DUF6188 family protein [Acidimicrobiales bacterium]
MRRRPAPRYVDVRGLRVVLSTRHRWPAWWALLRPVDPADPVDDHWTVVTVLDPDGTVVLRRRYGSGAEAQQARDRFVRAVAAMDDRERARATPADWAGLLDRLAARADPRRPEVLVLDDDGYTMPGVRGVAVAQVEVDVDLGLGGESRDRGDRRPGRVRLLVGAYTVVVGGAATLHGPGVEEPATPTASADPGPLVALRGAIVAGLVLRLDGRLELHLADGRQLVAPADWEVAGRDRVLAAARPGGVRLLP